ncbi:MAG: hypothetical protein P4N60_13970 [Verrucomicrobiae bacterium]|nr:hypothetical protein [Verrucomicrobiae bacterium]
MKTPNQSKGSQPSANPAGQRATGIRPHSARTLEHRYERRKIREQLRRLDWALNTEDEIFA